MTDTLVLLLRVLLAGAALAGTHAAARWMLAHSRPLGLLFMAAFVLRLGTGLFVNGVAAYDLPVLENLRADDGVWLLAPDVRTYLEGVSIVAREGIAAIPASMPSPTYVAVLGFWASYVVPGPLAGMTLNLMLFVVLAVVLVAAFRPAQSPLHERAALIVCAAFWLAPASVAHATQPLKDEFGVFLIAVTTLGVWRTFGSVPAPRAGVAAALLTALAMTALAGVRSHIALILLAAIGLGCVVLVLRHVTSWRHASTAVMLSLVMLGAAGYGYQTNKARERWIPVREATTRPPPVQTPPQVGGAQRVQSSPERATSMLAEPVAELRRIGRGFIRSIQTSRAGFVRIEGATALASSDQARPQGWDAARAAALGLAVTVVPMSLLKAAGVVTFDGGRGLLPLTDLDTVFFDVTVLAALLLVVRHRARVGANRAYLVAALAAGVLLAVLLSYVVTNYGSFVRMRLMIAAPFWLLPLALTPVRSPVPPSSVRLPDTT